MLCVAIVAAVGLLRIDARAQNDTAINQPNAQETPGEGLAFPGAGLENNRPPFLTAVAVDHKDHRYREGEPMKVGFQAERDAQLYLLYHQADGKSYLLFPNLARRDGAVPGGRPVQVPGPQDRFRLRTRPPFGREVLQVLASQTPLAPLERLVDGRSRTPQIPAGTFGELKALAQATPSLWAEHRVPIETLASDNPPTPKRAARAGLFIGIGEYQEPELAATHEELRHSAEVMHKLMLERGGLDPERTRLVTDKEATRKNLEQLIFGWLPSVTRPGDTVFIYFSGHAGQDDTERSDEPDGQDETLAPYDLTVGTDQMSREERVAAYRRSNIVDDTFARWLEELQGRQVVVILDTCHSGGLVAGKDLSRLLVDETRRVKDISQLNTVVLACCGSDEQALFEGTPNKTMWFTYFLAQAIETNRPLTVEQAFRSAQEGMRTIVRRLGAARVQEPTLTDRALLPIYLVPPSE